jgi:mycothiol synthase
VIGPLAPSLRDQVTVLADSVRQFDGVEAISEAPRLALAGGDPGVRHFLARRDRRLAGYAQLEARGPSAEMAVHPEARGLGVAAGLIEALAAAEPGLRLWAHGDLGPSRRVAAALGMVPVRELWEMTVPRGAPASPLDQPDPPAPAPAQAAFRIRPFDPAQDREAWVELNALAFADHPEQGRMTLHDLDQRVAQSWFDPAGLILAEGRPADTVTAKPAGPPGAAAPSAPNSRAPNRPELIGHVLIGYVWTKIEAGAGEIYAIGVHPAAQGQRLGTHLLELALRRLARQGVSEVRLFVEADNGRAIAAYRRQGFRLTRRDIQYGFAPT